MRIKITCLPVCLTAMVLFCMTGVSRGDPPAGDLAPRQQPVSTYAVPNNGNYEFVSYGTLTAHVNNLDRTYNQSFFGTENWAVRLLALGRNRTTTLRPYLVLYPSAQVFSNAGSDNFSFLSLGYGIGVEQRPLSQYTFGITWEWLSRIRLYSEYIGLSTLAGQDITGIPRQDWSVGFDLWREYGFVDPEHWQDDAAIANNHDTLWGELYLGSSYHSTSFSRRYYDGIRSGASLTIGSRLGSTRTPVMPYTHLQVDSSSRYAEDYFNNRILGGVGIRTEHHLSATTKIIGFVEYRGILAYLKAHPLFNNVPNNEWRVGLSYQVSRY